MTREEVRLLVKEELERMLNVLLTGSSQNSNGVVEDVVSMMQSTVAQTGRPIMRPYGMISRAPKGTGSVVGRIGTHAGNRFVMGHLDGNSPTLSNEGDVMLYAANGEQILLSGGNIKVGTGPGAAAARNGDSVELQTGATLVGTIVNSPPGPILSGQAVTLTLTSPCVQGQITSGSAKVTVEN